MLARHVDVDEFQPSSIDPQKFVSAAGPKGNNGSVVTQSGIGMALSSALDCPRSPTPPATPSLPSDRACRTLQ
jgi:hypothetical protein